MTRRKTRSKVSKKRTLTRKGRVRARRKARTNRRGTRTRRNQTPIKRNIRRKTNRRGGSSFLSPFGSKRLERTGRIDREHMPVLQTFDGEEVGNIEQAVMDKTSRGFKLDRTDLLWHLYDGYEIVSPAVTIGATQSEREYCIDNDTSQWSNEWWCWAPQTKKHSNR